MTIVPPRLGRRRVLLAGALAVAAVPLASACTPEPAQEQPDPLEALLTRASADAALAKATATTHPALAAQAGTVAGDRQQHAEALRKELERARPARASSTATAAPSTQPPAVPGQQAAALTALREAATAAEKEAAGLVTGLPPYRAGLVASVAACCASLREVLA
ncbi:hypothetical protein JOF53_006037 [Crossiella equi]|uniref:Uncharacterized protein n=1 Tax=Crossiella equi TaxID=130796 RepID=A0ABS5AKR8_9PSEU|nr:hypothetical protein [Crossiella equi]MBP2477165.1 hypothetical protein [Crossiella equi]